jgi:hypothetical protein
MEAAMTRYCWWFASVAWLAGISCGPSEAERAQQGIAWLSYEPAVVELRGTLSVVERYGPPNFGETPDLDQKLRVPILQLERPVNVAGDTSSQANPDTIRDVREIQLVFVGGRSDYEEYVDGYVVVTGRLLQRVSGHHFTAVVMMVESIDRAGQEGD